MRRIVIASLALILSPISIFPQELNSKTNHTPVSASATFIKVDAQTQGNWTGKYGTDGCHIVGDDKVVPSYLKMVLTDNLTQVWSASNQDVRAPLKTGSLTNRIASRWYRWSNDYFTIGLNFTDGRTHQVAIYCLDWENENEPRTQKIEILDTFSRATLDSQTVGDFSKGKYLLWNLRGNVTIKISDVKGDGTAISGLFFDRPGGLDEANDPKRKSNENVTGKTK